MKWNVNTTLIHGSKPHTKTGPIAQDLVPAVAYAFEDVDTAADIVAGKRTGTYYGRYGNPTTRDLEEKIAVLEGAEEALGVSSGMAAISSALLHFLEQGDHVLVTKDVYGGTYKFLTTFAPRYGITFDFIDCTDLDKVEQSIQPNTKVLYIESPSNPCLTVLDIRKLSDLAHSYQLKVIVDNTFMTPYLQKPIDLGADVVVHSATKYLNGHGDVVAGLVVGTTEDISNIRKNMMGDLGQNLNAWDSFLILRGLKTLGLRMGQHCDSAMRIALFLEGHPAIEKVYYPGLSSHPQFALANEQMKRAGGIVSFEVRGGHQGAKSFLNALNLIMISFSLGDPETLIQHPASMTHFSIPQSERDKFNIKDGLVRLSTGLEDIQDILADLKQALAVLEKKISQMGDARPSCLSSSFLKSI